MLMAGTGLPGSEILETQGQLILKAGGASESEMKKERDHQKRLIDIIATEKDEKAAEAKLATAWKEIVAAMPEAERKALDATGGSLHEAAIKGFNNAWFRYFLTYDPRPTLRTVRCPVLAINGEKDLQVSAKENLAEIAKALAGRWKHERQDGRVSWPESSLSAMQNRLTERVRHDRDDDCSRSPENDRRLDRAPDRDHTCEEPGCAVPQRRT